MAADLLDQILGRLEALPERQKRKVAEEVHQATAHMLWVPNPGPQTEAYFSEADVLLYGGQAGGGKSHLELGWCVNQASGAHIIFRRELAQTDGLEAEGKKIIGTAAGFNGQDREWTWPNGMTVKLGGMKDANSWQDHAGRERATMCFDEAAEFLELQVGSMLAWLRGEEGQRTRMILASNPPRTAEGYWIVEWFAPWLDEAHPLYGKAQPGELLWCVYIANQDGGQTIWVDGPGEYVINGETYTAMSRTFIPASLEDNPYRNNPSYRAKLQSLPEPLRSQLLKGDFKAGLTDASNQVIPTEWVRQAQKRWEANPRPPEGIPMCAIGIDPCGGGEDQMVMAPRYDAWFSELIKIPGKEMPKDKLGSFQAGLVVSNRRDNADVTVDFSGGYGAAVTNQLAENSIQVNRYVGSASTTKRTKDGKLTFTNVRSAAYWAFREALDPDQPGGSPICLPPDKRLLAGLCAPTYEVTSRGIKVEPKSKKDGGTQGVVERLGWSPDEADAVVMSWWTGPKAITHSGDWAVARQQRAAHGMSGMAPKVLVSHQKARRRR